MHFKDLINTIKERRQILEITQQDLAKLSDVSLRAIKKFESGNGNPTLKTIQKLADVLGLELFLDIKKNVTDEAG